MDTSDEGDGEKSKAEPSDKSDIGADLKAFFQLPEKQDEKPIAMSKEEKFKCPYCSRHLPADTKRCECGAVFIAEEMPADLVIEKEIDAFFNELSLLGAGVPFSEVKKAAGLERAEKEIQELDTTLQELEEFAIKEPVQEPEEFAKKEPVEEPEPPPPPPPPDVPEPYALEEALPRTMEPPPELKKEEVVELEVTYRRVKRDRALFYAGAAMLLLGGPVLAFSSLLHDVLGVPIMGETYDAFGWLNVTVAAAGLIVFIIGIILLLMSLRGGTLTSEELKALKGGALDEKKKEEHVVG